MTYVGMLTAMSHVKEALHDARRLSKIVFQFVHCMIWFPWVQTTFRNTTKHNDNVVSCIVAIMDISN